MYQSQIKEINKSINKTGKVIISLGCSFVQGQGAVDMELLEQYPVVHKYLTNEPTIGDDNLDEILEKFSLIKRKHDGNLDFTFMEYKNAFVNVLCNDYLNQEYTPINLGRRGNGNKATIKDLYFHPDIDWNKIKEYIVIYMPSGMERLDFVNDSWHDHNKWVSIWPHYNDVHANPRKSLWKSYNECLWSDKFEVLEQLSIVQELLLWCENKNARLITILGFDRRYDKNHFTRTLRKKYNRNIDHKLLEIDVTGRDDDDVSKIVDLFPWDSIFNPAGCENFADFALAQEFTDYKNINFYEFLKTGSPKLWITPCAHPSAKAHQLLAKELFKFIKGLS